MSDTTLVGNVTRDPELRFTPSGAATASFGLAVNRRWQKNGQWEESTSFFDVVCWRELAENLCESVQRGARVIVTGRLDQHSFETEGGEKRSRVQLIADEIGPSLRWATAQVVKNERRGPTRSVGESPTPSEAPEGRPMATVSAPSVSGDAGEFPNDDEPF